MPASLWICHIFWVISIAFSSVLSAADIMQHPSWSFFDSEKCGSSIANRIVGGHNAGLGQYRWMARIGLVDTLSSDSEILFKCGGTLINENYVVTAGHCVTNGRFKVGVVRIGEYRVDTDPDCEYGICAPPVQDFEPASIIIPPKYDQPKYSNDIALIRLNRPVEYNDYVQPLCMIRGSLLTKDFVGENAEIAGWGVTDSAHQLYSNVLQALTVPIVPNSRCKAAFEPFVSVEDDDICAGGILGQDSCSGDSGGPLMKVENIDGQPKYYFIGIIAFGKGHCGDTDTPVVHTKVSSHLEWILDHVSP